MADRQVIADFSRAMGIATSGLRAQAGRMRVISENIANADSTASTPNADPYRKQTPVFTTKVLPGGFKGVSLSRVDVDQTAFRREYNPGHPAADAQGYVKMPNVNSLVELGDMREAQQSYQASVDVITVAKNMLGQALSLLKS